MGDDQTPMFPGRSHGGTGHSPEATPAAPMSEDEAITHLVPGDDKTAAERRDRVIADLRGHASAMRANLIEYRNMGDTDLAAACEHSIIMHEEAADLLAVVPVSERPDQRLLDAIKKLHAPEGQEAEVWWGDGAHDQRFPDCPGGDDCEGHVCTITVCSECGYTHDGETPIFRQWPCPTLRAVEAVLPDTQADSEPEATDG